MQKFVDLADLEKMLKNKYVFNFDLISKIDFDRAENGHLKVCQKLAKS